MTTNRTLSILYVAIASGLLAACGGGGSVRAVTPASAPPDPPPPPSSAPAEPCPSPVTADCTVDVPQDQDMTGGRQSDHALIKRGDGRLTLISRSNTFGPPVVDYRFSGGTTVEAGALRVASSASLHSNVTVQAAGSLTLDGDMTGDVTNHGNALIRGTVSGNAFNDGALTPGSYNSSGSVVPARIEGNFTQASGGTLDAVIGATTGGYLSVTGRADIDGTLRLIPYTDDWGPYPLPAAPLSLKVLHADGGVFGQFAQWTSPGLFITGAPRYVPNDVYFDITAISAAQAMSAARAVRVDPLTLGAAAHFDAALGDAGRWATMPRGSLTAAQRQFLASAGAIQRLQDYDKAIRSFDSLSGHGYADAADSLLQQAALPAPELMARVANLHAGSRPGSWSAGSTMLASGAGAFRGERAGFDQWFGDHTLLGYSFGWSDGSLRFDRSGGAARDQSPQWDVYVQRNLDGDAYVFGDIGYSRHQLDFNRPIDLGIARYAAGARNSFDTMHTYIEAGRGFRLGQSRLTPFGAVSYAILHGAGFTEQGSTGFELIAQQSMQQRLSAAAGFRLASEWRAGGNRWTRFNLTAGYLQLLQARDGARAAFTGAPDMTFVLDGVQGHRNTGWLQMNLATGNEHWNWLLSYDRQASDEALSLGAKFDF
ncbi:MAG TPA: autotransporter domain-containing protein [Rhodanobacteraceae bacterium]|nr:autotransporter domain-containing protein [Rhodanobacteraceae bacterium]